MDFKDLLLHRKEVFVPYKDILGLFRKLEAGQYIQSTEFSGESIEGAAVVAVHNDFTRLGFIITLVRDDWPEVPAGVVSPSLDASITRGTKLFLLVGVE